MRYAIRSLLRAPGFTCAAVVTLAIGIGAASALFSVGHAVLLKPLPYRDADRLAVVLAEQNFEGAARPVRASFPTAAVNAWPSSGNTYERVAFVSRQVAAVREREATDLIDVAVVSELFFETLGGEILLGRGLTPGDDLQPVAVISASLWRRLHGEAADLAGRQVTLNEQPYAIVGVVRDTLQIPQPGTEAWLPAGFSRSRNAECCGFIPVVRAKVGAAPEALHQEVAAIVGRLAQEVPRSLGGARVQIVPLREFVVGDTRASVLVLGAAVGILLLLACANVMNLLLARATERTQEMRIRRALGASSLRLALHSLSESALLSVTAGMGGVGLAAAAIRLLKSGVYAGVPRLDAVEIDGPMLVFALVTSAVTACTVALLPALRWTDAARGFTLRQQGSGRTRAGRAALRALTVTQLALSVVLLVGAALLGRSLSELMRTDIGVEPDGVATASLNLAMNRRLTDYQQIELVERVVARVTSLPEVTAAGVGTARPPNASRMRVTLNRSDDPNARASYQAAGIPVTPGYFQALGIRLERGRFFTDGDHRQARPVVILSSRTARSLFRDDDPLGRTVGLPVLRDGVTGNEEMTVVGITSDVKYGGLDHAAEDLVYRPFAQQTWRSVFVMVRTSGDPSVLAALLRREIAAVDRDIVVADVTTLNAVLSEVTATPRVRTALLMAFAGLATVIAAVGLYGVVAYSVSTRTAEIGIRMALGADRRQIRALVLREGTVLAVAGTALGLCGAFAVARLLSSVLYGIGPSDPPSYLSAAATLVTIALGASAIPADRAANTDPMTALRAE